MYAVVPLRSSSEQRTETALHFSLLNVGQEFASSSSVMSDIFANFDRVTHFYSLNA